MPDARLRDILNSGFTPPRIDPAPTTRTAQTLRICIAEDDDDIRVFMSIIIERAGFETEAYTNGLDALTAARRDPADLYVLDRRMPGMTGDQLCRELRAAPTTEHSVIMLVSAETADLALAAEEAGADAYLPKPFSRQALLAKIADLLGEREG